MPAMMLTKSGRVKAGRPDTKKGCYQSDVIRSKARDLPVLAFYFLGDPRGIYGSLIEI